MKKLAFAFWVMSIALQPSFAEEVASYNIEVSIKSIGEVNKLPAFELTFCLQGTRTCYGPLKNTIEKDRSFPAFYKIDLTQKTAQKILETLYGKGVVITGGSSYISFHEKALHKKEVKMDLLSALNGVYSPRVKDEKDKKSFAMFSFNLPIPELPGGNGSNIPFTTVIPTTIPGGGNKNITTISIEAGFALNNFNVDQSNGRTVPRQVITQTIAAANLSDDDYKANYVVFGYASPDNPAHVNSDLTLSQKRAESVVALMKNGINGKRFTGNIRAVGKGQTTRFSNPALITDWINKLTGKTNATLIEIGLAKEKALSPNRAIVIQKE